MVGDGRSELGLRVQTVILIDFYAEHTLSLRVVFLHFDCFFLAIKGHQINASLLCLDYVIFLLSCICKNDASRCCAETQYFVDLG